MKKTGVLLVIVGLSLWRCAVTDLEKTADLGKYKSFAWGKSNISAEDPFYKGDLVDSRIKTEIMAEFQRKGVAYKPKKSDLLVSYQASAERTEHSYSSGGFYAPYYPYPFMYSRYGYYPYGWYMYGGPIPYWTGPYQYATLEGSLVIQVKDRKTGKLVWQGVVHGNVDNAKALSKNISRGVKAIMKKYPAVPPAPPLLPIVKDKVL